MKARKKAALRAASVSNKRLDRQGTKEFHRNKKRSDYETTEERNFASALEALGLRICIVEGNICLLK
jgi:hypothetical protein